MAVDTVRILLLALLLGVASSVPIQDVDQTTCSRKCPPFQKTMFGGFTPGESYRFTYKGKSNVAFSKKAHSNLDLEAEVVLSFYHPCDVSVQITKPLLNGERNNEIVEILTKYPLMAGVSNGIVTDVCAHPDDEPVSLNFKKGILSTLQNSMPHITQEIHTTITETDVLGICPTNYQTIFNNDLFQVIKVKDHKGCIGQHTADNDSPLKSLFLKSTSLSIVNESVSECTLRYDPLSSILKSAGCVDLKIAVLDDDKMVAAEQTSEIQLQGSTSSKVPKLKKIRRTNLIFEMVPEPTSELLVPVVKKQLKQLCEELHDVANENAAVTYENLIQNLKKVPRNDIKQLLNDIKAGKFCPKHDRLYQLYLDALAYINNAGAVEVMVDQVLSSKVSGGRTFLYTIALQLIKKPCIHSVQAVTPLFESKSAPSMMVLAAGSLIRKYCNFNKNCLQEKSVIEILQKLADRIDSTCSSSNKSNEKRLQALTLLKSIGNIGEISKPLEKSILKCLTSEEADTFVRVSSAQAFRQSSCKTKPTEKLLDIALNRNGDMEVRIASYLAAVTCANYRQFSLMLSKLEKEPNKQVQSFIYSHLRSLQKSEAPYLRGLSYNLTTLSIPFVYNKDILRLSRSVDTSYYLPTFGIGGGVESSTIYSPDSPFPRQIGSNYTLNLFDNIFNVAEYNLRTQDLETIFIKVVMKALEHHKRKDISLSDVLEALNIKQKSEFRSPKLDAFVRIFGQEMAFMSASPSEHDFNVKEILDKLVKFFDKVFLDLVNNKVLPARGGRISTNQLFPTAQGIPVQLKAVFVSASTSEQADKKGFDPASSFYVNVFAGFNMGAKTGFRVKVKGFVSLHIHPIILFSKENFKIILDMPKKTKILDIHYSCTMINKLPGKKGDIVLFPKQGYPTYTEDKCYNRLPAPVNLKICSHLKSPDYKKVKMFPFGEIEMTFDASKLQQDKEILKAMVNAKYEKTEKSFDLTVEAPGTKNPDLLEFSLLHKTSSNTNSFLVFTRCQNKKATAIQVNVKTRKSSSGSQHNILVYYSNKKRVSSADQVMALKYRESRRDKTRMEFYLNTKNNLKKYVDTNITVDLNSDSPSSLSTSRMELNRFDFNLTIPQKFHTAHYIRSSKKSNDRVAYDFHSLSRTPTREIMKLAGNYSSEGKYSLMTRVSHAHVSVKFLDLDLCILSQHVFTKKKKQFHYSLKTLNEEKTLFLTEASVLQLPTSDSSYSVNAQVQIPDFIPTYVITGEYDKISAVEIFIRTDLKENGRVLYKADGTVFVEKTNSLFKERAEIKIEDVRSSNEYVVKYHIFFKEGSKDVLVVLSSNRTPFFSGEVELITGNDLISTTMAVTVPKIIDAKLKAEKTKTLLHMALNSYLLPNTEDSRKIRASSYLNLIDKEMKVRFDYDLEKDPKKKIEFMTRYDYNYERKYASVKGELVLQEEKYLFGAEAILGSYTRDPNNKNLLRIKVIMPNGKDFLLHSECLLIKGTLYRTTTHSILIQTPSGDRHQLKGGYKYDFSKAPAKMMIAGRNEIDSPIVKKIVIVIDSALDVNEVFQIGHCKMEVEGEKIPSKIRTDLEFSNQEKDLKAKALLDLGTSSNFRINSETRLTRNNERRISDASVQLTVDLSDSKNYNVNVKKDPKSVLLELSFNDKVIVVLEQSNPEKGVWSAKLTTPLRRTEAHSSLSSDAIILTLYPNRIASEDRYEAEGHFRQKESKLETGARFTHPGRKNDIRLQVNIENKDHSTSHGRVEIDIFDTPQDKIVIKVRTQKSERNNSLKMEADFEIPNQVTVPRLDVEAAFSKTDKHLEIYLRKSPKAEPKLSYVIRINRPTFKSSMVYSKLSTSKQNIEMISELKHHQLLQCTGNTLNGTITSKSHGSFDFKSAVCAPGYFELGVKKLSEDKIYMTKVGMKRPDAAKIAIDLVFDNTDAITVDNFWKMESTFNLYGEHRYLPKRPVVLVGAKLWRSRFVTMDVVYHSRGVKDHYKNVIEPAYDSVKKVAMDLSEELPKEIRENIFVKIPKVAVELAKEFRNLREKLSQEFTVVMEEFGITVPNLKELREKFEAFWQRVVDVYEKFIRKTDDLLNYLGIHTGIEKILKFLHDLDARIQKFLVKAAKEVREVIDKIRDGNLEELPGAKWLSNKLGFNFFDWIKEKWDNIKDFFLNKFKAIRKFIHHYAHAIKRAIKNLYKNIMNLPLVKKYIKLIESWFSYHNWWDYKTLYRSRISKYFFSVTPEDALIRLQFPVKKPTHSLAVAMRNIGASIPQKQMKKESK